VTVTTAMILAAGRGSRLAPLTDTLPKPLFDIGGRPLIAHQLDRLLRAGIQRVVINLFHLGHLIERALGAGDDFGVEICYSREPEPLETGGGIRFAQPLLGDAPFLLLNGDIWTDFDFCTLPDSLPPSLLGHLVVTPTPSHRQSGDFGYNHRRVNRLSSDYVYCGIALINPAILGDAQGPFSLQGPLFAAADAGRLSAQRWAGEWTDIGTIEQLQKARASVLGR